MNEPTLQTFGASDIYPKLLCCRATSGVGANDFWLLILGTIATLQTGTQRSKQFLEYFYSASA